MALIQIGAAMIMSTHVIIQRKRKFHNMETPFKNESFELCLWPVPDKARFGELGFDKGDEAC